MTVDVSFVTSGHDVADARLHRLVAAVHAAGLTTEVRGLGLAVDGPAGSDVHVVPRRSMVGRVVTAVRHASSARGRVLVALDPDSFLTCLAVARLRRRKVVADVHEDYAALLRDRPWARGWRGRVGGLVAAGASRLAAAADLVVVADEHVPPREAPSRLVVTNQPEAAMLPVPTERDEQPRALYVGDVRASRGLFTMVEAVRDAPGWQLDVVGPVAGSDQPRLDEILSDPELGARVRLWGRQPPVVAWQRAEGAWCGFVLLDHTPAFVDALPSKLAEYLCAGLAVVSSDLPRQAEVVERSGAGVVIASGPGQADAVADQLRRWSDDPSDLDARRDAARAWRDHSMATEPYAVFAQRVRGLAAPRH